MPYVKIENGVVVQRQPDNQDGFILASDNVYPGYLYDGTNFSQPPISADKSQVILKNEALAKLLDTDMVAIRCLKAGVEFPADWQQYTTQLREIISTGQGSIPSQPDYPENT